MFVAWLHTIAAVLVFLLVRSIPMPGVDTEALRALEQSSGTSPFFPGSTSAAIAGGGILWLVIFRALAALLAKEPFDDNARVKRIACALYLFSGMVRGFFMALYLENLDTGFGSVVEEPGLRFRLLVTATSAAGSAVEWALADWISKRGVGRGPLVLFAVMVLSGGASELARFGQIAGRDGVAGFHAWISLAATIPLALVLFALSRRGTIEWPVPVKRGLVLTSPIDLLVVPYLVGRLTLELIQRPVMLAAQAQGGRPFEWLSQLDTMAALATAAGITVWLLGRPSRGVSPGYLVAAIFAPLLAIVPVAAAIAADKDASIARFIGRGRGFEGSSRFEVLLTAEGGDGGRDAPILVQRLRAFGIKGKILESSLGRIRLRLTGSENLGEALSRVLLRGKLSIAPLAGDQAGLAPSAERTAKYPSFEVRQDYDGTGYYVARTRGELDSLIADARETIPKDRWIAVEDLGEAHAAFVLEPEVLTERDVKKARVTSDNELGAPNIQLDLTAAGATKFGDLTARIVRRKLAIVLDGQILSAPVVQSRIDGGSVSISLGMQKPIEDQYAEARALAAALQSRATSREWSLASIVASSE